MYKFVVFASIAVLFAWPLTAALILDLDDEAVGVSSMVLVSAFLVALDAYWWWRLFLNDQSKNEGGGGAMFEFKFWQSLTVVGVLAGFWFFGPMTEDYPDHLPIWIAMVLGPTVIGFARMMMGFSGWDRS